MDHVVIHIEGPIKSRLSGATVRLEFASGDERFRLAISANDFLASKADMDQVVRQWRGGKAEVVKLGQRGQH